MLGPAVGGAPGAGAAAGGAANGGGGLALPAVPPGGPAYGGGAPPGPWLLGRNGVAGPMGIELQPGDILEAVTHEQGTDLVNGTALFQLTTVYEPGPFGRFFEVVLLGASSPEANERLSQVIGFRVPAASRSVVRWCSQLPSACVGVERSPGRHVIHVEQVRQRPVSSIN